MIIETHTGSCGIIESFERSSCKPIRLISILSMTILPLEHSSNRNKANVNVDLPAPVRPTIPIYSKY